MGNNIYSFSGISNYLGQYIGFGFGNVNSSRHQVHDSRNVNLDIDEGCCPLCYSTEPIMPYVAEPCGCKFCYYCISRQEIAHGPSPVTRFTMHSNSASSSNSLTSLASITPQVGSWLKTHTILN